MTIKHSYSLGEFRLANPSKSISALDYVRSIYKSNELPPDFIVCYSRLYKPDIRLEANRIFIADLFDRGRYDDLLAEGNDIDATQWWINLLEITGLFDGLTEVQALNVANDIAYSWNLLIEAVHPSAIGRASVIHDQATGEVFVTLGTICKTPFPSPVAG